MKRCVGKQDGRASWTNRAAVKKQKIPNEEEEEEESVADTLSLFYPCLGTSARLFPRPKERRPTLPLLAARRRIINTEEMCCSSSSLHCFFVQDSLGNNHQPSPTNTRSPTFQILPSARVRSRVFSSSFLAFGRSIPSTSPGLIS